MALVIVTLVYTIHTKAMAREMKSTRLLSTSPRISLDVNMRGPKYVAIRVVNIGHGPAIEPRLTIVVAAFKDKRPWTAHVLAPGESVEFHLHDAMRPNHAIGMDEAIAANAVVELEGTAQDLYGNEHHVTDTFDLADWWRTVVAAGQAYQQDPHEVTNIELKKLREAAEEIQSILASETA